jgi:hypothetical protein
MVPTGYGMRAFCHPSKWHMTFSDNLPQDCWVALIRLRSLKEILPFCLTEVVTLKKFLKKHPLGQKLIYYH